MIVGFQLRCISASVIGAVIGLGAAAQPAPIEHPTVTTETPKNPVMFPAASDWRGAMNPPATRDAVEPAGIFGLFGVRLELGPEGEVIPPCTVERSAGSLRSAPQDRRWPGAVVPFDFDINVSQINRDRTSAALAVIEAACGVDFVVRAGQGTYLRFRDTTPGNGCAGTDSDPCSKNSSLVGAPSSGQRTVRIVSWSTPAIIIHEVMHALGFEHEQCRPDRDTYVEIVAGNIPADELYNFNIEPTVSLQTPYDFASVMHYGRCWFTTCSVCSDPCRTIRMRPGYEAYQDQIGQRDGLSPLDTHGLRCLYPRPDWRFVRREAAGVGSGAGLDPWQQTTSALLNAPASSTVFIMPGTYAGHTQTFNRPMTLVAPVGGVTLTR